MKKYQLLICAIFIFFSGCSLLGLSKSAPLNVGRAPYAITSQNFNCTAYKTSVGNLANYGISFLWNSFGNSYSCLDSELNNPKVNLVEVHLVNGPCIRDKRCGSYEYFSTYTTTTLAQGISNSDPSVIAEFKNAATNLATYLLPKLREGVSCYINPVLENNLSEEQLSTVVSWISPIFQNRCSFVWNPEGAEPGLPATGTTISEGHGANPSFVNNQCFANPDGATITTLSQWTSYLSKYGSSCVQAFTWTPNDNCLTPNAPFLDPRSRTCSDISEYPLMTDAINQIIE
jgi:hypothetical protein